jgi:hypothetical protein
VAVLVNVAVLIGAVIVSVTIEVPGTSTPARRALLTPRFQARS